MYLGEQLQLSLQSVDIQRIQQVPRQSVVSAIMVSPNSTGTIPGCGSMSTGVCCVIPGCGSRINMNKSRGVIRPSIIPKLNSSTPNVVGINEVGHCDIHQSGTKELIPSANSVYTEFHAGNVKDLGR